MNAAASALSSSGPDFEFAALRECAHAHVLEVLAAAHVGTDTYIALERCEGDLTALLTAPTEAPESTVARLMRQVRARGRRSAPLTMCCCSCMCVTQFNGFVGSS